MVAPQPARLLAWAVRVGRRRAALKATTLGADRARADRPLDRLLRVPAPRPAGRAVQARATAWRGSSFVFLEDRAVPAANNVGERALRPSVVARKVTDGFRSIWGADGHALVRSPIDTAKLGGVRPFAAIRRALQGPPRAPRLTNPVSNYQESSKAMIRETTNRVLGTSPMTARTR